MGPLFEVGRSKVGTWGNYSGWRVSAISTGNGHTVGLNFDGTVVVGINYYGQCDISEWNLPK